MGISCDGDEIIAMGREGDCRRHVGHGDEVSVSDDDTYAGDGDGDVGNRLGYIRDDCGCAYNFLIILRG